MTISKRHSSMQNPYEAPDNAPQPQGVSNTFCTIAAVISLGSGVLLSLGAALFFVILWWVWASPMMNDGTSLPVEFKAFPVGVAAAIAGVLQPAAAAAWKRHRAGKATLLNVMAIGVFAVGCLITKFA